MFIVVLLHVYGNKVKDKRPLITKKEVRLVSINLKVADQLCLKLRSEISMDLTCQLN